MNEGRGEAVSVRAKEERARDGVYEWFSVGVSEGVSEKTSRAMSMRNAIVCE